MNTLPLLKAVDLPAADTDHAWLIEPLWADGAVGLIGGEPKCCKSFLALSMALSVASGTPCLGHFHARKTGSVLIYAAEDALSAIRTRLIGMCARQHLAIEQLELYFITVPSLRLDRREDCLKLASTVDSLKPALVVLDPFVRLHRVDENVSQEIVPLLATLRELQRRFGCAVVLVHHAKKGAGHLRAGQALRGSSEFHAWSDSGLFLRRRGERLHLTVEHRAHPTPQPVYLKLDTQDGQATLTVEQPSHEDVTPQSDTRTPEQRILAALGTASRPLRVRELRELCKLRTATLCNLLDTLAAQGTVLKTNDGFLKAGAIHQPVVSSPATTSPTPAASDHLAPDYAPPSTETDAPQKMLFPFLCPG